MSGVMIGRLAAVLGVVLATAVAVAPAAWLGDLLTWRSPLRLIHAEGTLWHGSGLIAVSDGQRARMIPGRVAWDVESPALFSGQLVFRVRHPGFDKTIRIAIDGRAVRIAAGEARVPAALLAVLGAPFNTVRPGGTLRLRWDTLDIVRDGFQGDVQMDWEDAQSALSPIAPLGSYRVVAEGRGARAEAKLTTLKGPLMLEGQASMENGRIRFTGSAEAQPEMRASLSGLIAVLGRRAGDRAILKWEL